MFCFPHQEEDVTRITNLSLQDLIRQIKEGEISPPEALQAYQTKVGQNCRPPASLIKGVVYMCNFVILQ